MATPALTNVQKIKKSIMGVGIDRATATPLKTSKDTCIEVCKDSDIEAAMIFGNSENSTYINDCIEGLIQANFATCGETVLSNNDISARALESTNNIMKLLRKYGYTQYRLPGVGECDILGWGQGKDDSDCWIDSFLFSLFANNNIANKLILQIDRKYYETDYEPLASERCMNNALFCITLYLNLLNARSALLKKSRVGDIKSTVKWCAVFYILKYFKHTEDSETYNSLLSFVTLDEKNLTIASGGDPKLLAYFFSKITNIFHASIDIRDYTNINDIREIIKSMSISKNTQLFSVSLPLTPTVNHAKERYFPVLESLLFKNAGSITLEAIVTGISGHARAYTECGIQWRYYDNIASVTTSSISKAKIRDDLNNILHYEGKTLPGTIMFIYRVNANFKGFSGGTLKIKRRRNRTRKIISGGKWKNRTQKQLGGG